MYSFICLNFNSTVIRLDKIKVAEAEVILETECKTWLSTAKKKLKNHNLITQKTLSEAYIITRFISTVFGEQILKLNNIFWPFGTSTSLEPSPSLALSLAPPGCDFCQQSKSTASAFIHN